MTSNDFGVSPVGDDAASAVVERIGDPVFGFDEDWQLSYANDRAVSLFDTNGEEATRDAIVGSQIDDLSAVSGTSLHEQLRRAKESGEQQDFEEYVAPLEAWMSGTIHPSSDGLSVYVREVMQDRHRRAELDSRVTVMEEIYEVMSDRSKPLDERIKTLLDIGSVELDIEYGALSEIRDEEYNIEALRAPDLPVEEGDTLPLDGVFCERTVENRETLVIADVTKDAPELTDRLVHQALGLTCYVGTPITVDGEIHGSFCFCDTESRDRAFADWEVTLVDLIGRWISYTLERRKVEDRLQHQNDRLEQFASLVSHDLRNPLNVAAGHLEIAKEQYDDEVHEEIEHSLERMRTIISDILMMARQGDPVDEYDRIELPAVGESAWSTVDTKAATLETEEGVVYGDETRLKRLLENLYRNAIEHGGTDVTISVGPLEGQEGFCVEDDGSGIPEEKHEQVLEFGYTTETEGTGFGLTIVQQIAEAHGWSFTVTSSDDGGARFEFDAANSS